jgi:predicted HAD superfamily Cof-like phosphohydrolase
MITGEDIDRCFDEALEADRLRSKTPLQMVTDFATAMGQPLKQPYPTATFDDLELLRMKLIHEEYEEVRDSDTAAECLKELADLVYVTYGYAATYGWDLDEAVRRVHASNMSKLGPDGKPIYREDGKVLKGPRYAPPDLSDLV